MIESARGAYARFVSAGTTEAWTQDLLVANRQPRMQRAAAAITTTFIEAPILETAPATQQVDTWAEEMWDAYMEGVVPDVPPAALVDAQAQEMWEAYQASFAPTQG